jgi:hypothetical protein
MAYRAIPSVLERVAAHLQSSNGPEPKDHA